MWNYGDPLVRCVGRFFATREIRLEWVFGVWSDVAVVVKTVLGSHFGWDW